MPGTTVVGWDGGAAATSVIDWAADRENRGSRSLVIVRVTDDVGDGRAQTGARMAVDAEARRIRSGHPGLRVRTDVRVGDPGDVLRRLADAGTLVVVGGASGSDDLFAGRASASRLVATASGPIAVVPSGVHGGSGGVGGIVVGVDGTDPSLAALDFAAREAIRWDERLLAVHAWLLPLGADVFGGPHHTAETFLRHQHEALLAEAMQEVVVSYPSLRVTSRVVQGLAAKVLLEASRGARILVVGNHGRTRIARFLLGSVSRFAVRALESTVIVVREPRADLSEAKAF